MKSDERGRKAAQAQGYEYVSIKDREIISMIAYLQRLGTDIKVKTAEESDK